MSGDRDTCDTCKFFELTYRNTVYKTTQGKCHRRAPESSDGFPEMKGTDWCGEHRDRAESANQED